LSTASLNAAAELLRPPEPGLAYLRHDRAGELTLEPGSLAIAGGRIAALHSAAGADIQVDARGCSVLPGFVDCHTHLPFAGWREHEYAQRVAGVPYEEIARRGGGIRASARALREQPDERVLTQAARLAGEMLAQGTTTLETKSGYGLSVEGELRALGLARALGERVAQPLHRTALLAHAVPDGHDGDSWMDTVAEMLPAAIAAGAPQALDIYVESVAFANRHLTRMGELARAHGLDLRAHVEQFSSTGAVPVALDAGARSVDHLACLPPEHVAPLAGAECAAVLLPGAEFLGREHAAPARALADAGAICVLGTDLNPGTSPITSIPLIIGLAVRMYGFTAEEAVLAATLNAAWVLRCSGDTGTLEPGKRADVLVLDGPLSRIPYRLGHNPVALAFSGGRLAYVRPDAAWRVQGLEP
jgi:imidazolonepropionase